MNLYRGGAMLPVPFGGGLVLLDEQRQRLHLLNPAAAAIWTLVDAGPTDAEAAAVLASHSRQSEAACADDIAAMKDQWEADGIFGDAPAVPPRPLPLLREGDGSTTHYDVCGLRFAFSSDSARVAGQVAAALGQCVAPPSGEAFRVSVVTTGDSALQLLVDDAPWLTASTAGEIAGALNHVLLHRLWGEDGWLTMIHAAALERDGSAILLPGRSGSGKTTLAAYLSRRGSRLLADDLAAVRADGEVVPWPTQLSIKRGSWRTLSETLPELDALPEREVAERRVKLVPAERPDWKSPPVPVRALVFPQWSQRRSPAALRLGPMEALASLIDDRMWAGWPMTEASVRAVLDWLERVPAWRIVYPDLVTAEAQISEVRKGWISCPKPRRSHRRAMTRLSNTG